MAKHAATEAPIFKVDVDVTENGTRLTETVAVTLEDFALDDLRTLAYWEEVDPDAYSRFADGELSMADFGASALRLRGFMFALTRGKVTDSRIRNAMTLSDFTMTVSEIQAIAQVLEETPVDARR